MDNAEINAQIRPARLADRSEIELIWQIVFADDDEYINYFLDHYFEAGSAMVLTVGGTILSVVYMVPLGNLMVTKTPGRTACTQAADTSCASIYSFATLPEFQGKGYGKALLQAAIAEMKRRGYQYDVICPAEEALFGYYQKYFGYRRFFTVRELDWDLESADKASTEMSMISAAPETYRSTRNGFLAAHSGGAFIDFDARSLKHQKCISGLYGGDIYILDYGGGHGCCCVEYSDESEVMVKELLIPDHLIPSAMRAVGNRFGPRDGKMKYRVRMPEWIGANYGGTLRDFAMILPPGNGSETLANKRDANDTSAFQTEHGYENHGYYGFAFD